MIFTAQDGNFSYPNMQTKLYKEPVCVSQSITELKEIKERHSSVCRHVNDVCVFEIILKSHCSTLRYSGIF